MPGEPHLYPEPVPDGELPNDPEWVRYLQNYLNHWDGESPVAVTERFDEDTKRKVIELREHYGMAPGVVDGLVDDAVWERLLSGQQR